MLEQSFQIQQDKIYQFHPNHHHHNFMHDNTVQPWQIQPHTHKLHHQNKIKQINIQKLPDVQKFLSTVKNISLSPTQKKRKQLKSKQGLENNYLCEEEIKINQQEKYQMEYKINNKKKQVKSIRIAPISLQYNHYQKLIEKANQSLNLKNFDNTFDSYYKKNIPMIPILDKHTSLQNNLQNNNSSYRNNVQKFLRLKDKIRKQKLSFIQRGKNPYLFKQQQKNQDIDNKYEEKRIVLPVNLPSGNLSERYSYFTFQEKQLGQEKPKKQPIKNFFLLNQRFKKQKSKQKEQKYLFKKQEQILNEKIYLKNGPYNFNQTTLSFFNTVMNSSRSKPKQKIKQIYVK